MEEGRNQPNAESTAGQSGNPKEEQKARRHRRRRRRLRALRAFLFRIAALALVVYVLLFHIVGVTVMGTGDMVPRMDAGDLILFYRLDSQWKAQDVIVIEKAVESDYSPMPLEKREKPWWRRGLDWIGFKDPEDPPTKQFICRVVAGPGDSVEVTENRLVINGNSMIESGIYYPTNAYVGYTEYPVKLKENEYFVMADFRNGGVDSRFFGPVTAEEIRGTVITVVRRNNL